MAGTGGRDEDRALRKDSAEAAQLYERFFDRNILDAEQEPILQAVRSTWQLDQAESAAQVVDEHRVHLVEQDLNVAEHGDWADVELYEVYANETSQRQEVIYYFSLPESAVITGLWLGNHPERALRFEYRVSPRGAAQATYRNEVVYYRDPALVEQIGPRQYRLRIFPVEGKRWQASSSGPATALPSPQLYVWMTWRVLAKDGAWPMPRLAEKHNVYWDATSARLVNGRQITEASEDWLPATVPAASTVKPATHRVDLPGGQTVLAQPISTAPVSAAPLRLAVVLDRSRSVARFEADVKVALARLAQAGGEASAVDVYLTSSQYRGEPPSRTVLAALDSNNIMYYGGQDPVELLAQFSALQAGEKYDAVVVLTDGAGYKLGSGTVAVPLDGAPDRFQREFEQAGETKGQNALLVTAVPEPEEWLLLALAAGLLGWYWRSTRRQTVTRTELSRLLQPARQFSTADPRRRADPAACRCVFRRGWQSPRG